MYLYISGRRYKIDIKIDLYNCYYKDNSSNTNKVFIR